MPAPALDSHQDASPTFSIPADELWRFWLEVAGRQPRTRLISQDTAHRQTLHVQRSRIFDFPISCAPR